MSAQGGPRGGAMRRGARTRTIAATILVVAILVIAAIVLWPRAAGTGEPAERHAHAGTVPSAGTPSPAVLRFAGTPVNPPAAESAGSVPQTSLAEAAVGVPAREGAEALGAPREAVDPAQIIAPGAALGGCLAEYGTAGQCLPAIPPSLAAHYRAMLDAGLDADAMPHPWTCGEVRSLFPEGIAVRVPDIDPQALDDDLDGVACEPDP